MNLQPILREYMTTPVWFTKSGWTNIPHIYVPCFSECIYLLIIRTNKSGLFSGIFFRGRPSRPTGFQWTVGNHFRKWWFGRVCDLHWKFNISATRMLPHNCQKFRLCGRSIMWDIIYCLCEFTAPNDWTETSWICQGKNV